MTEYKYSEIERSNSLKSARAVVPFVIEAVKPKSVLDVGCADGDWLLAFKENGVENLFGVDNNSTAPKLLKIPFENYRHMDLNYPIPLDRRFDLAICLEVGEHLNPDKAGHLVRFLTAHSDNVLFGAAIPFQLGDGHQNEQFQSYWAKLFAEEGYYPSDVVRPKVWDNPEVGVWFKQNTLLYTKKKSEHPVILDIVHPDLFLIKMNSRALKLIRRIRWW